MSLRTGLLFATNLVLFLAACESSDETANPATGSEAGGVSGASGATGSSGGPMGGGTVGGGTVGAGGAFAGAPGQGGTVGQGGHGQAGGVPTAGGALGQGGAVAQGGTSGQGGAGQGGSSCTSSCVAGVQAGDVCDPSCDVGECPRSNRVCTCSGTFWTCVSTDGQGGATGEGGAPGSGGALGQGGIVGNGGVSGVGGLMGEGGASSQGGASAQGGALGEGGGEPTGGTSGEGGSGGLGSGDGTTPITVWLAGDSTVANGSTPCPRGWGMFFDALFNDKVTVTNLASGGKSIRSWQYATLTTSSGKYGEGECDVEEDASGNPIPQDRWQQMLDGMSPGDYLFIQFGINETVATCSDSKYPGRHVGMDRFKEEHGLMAAAAIERGTQPIFITPTSELACSGSTATRGRGEWPKYVRDAGEDYSVPVIDLNQLSVDLYNQRGLCPLDGDGFTSTTSPGGLFFCDDHTHFSDQGAPEIAKVVLKALSDASIGLANYAL